MTTGTDETGPLPTYWWVTVEALPEAEAVGARIRDGKYTKVVALVGYDDDAEAGRIARRLPYGHRGEGIEEIVFCRVGPPTGEVVQFEDDAWPGEDRTYVLDDVAGALALATRFAVEYGGGSLVVVVGGREFLAAAAHHVV